MTALLRLVRFPGPLMAPADVIAGWGLVGGVAGRPCPGMLVASALLYAGGMALNDVADHRRDREQRPDRPIPSGALSVGQAALVGGGLLLGGVGVASLACRSSLAVACGVAACVLAYDFALKRSAIGGAVGMALCRCGNLLLGAAAGLGAPADVLAHPALVAGLVAMGVYVFGLTLASEAEDSDLPRWARALSLAMMLGAVGLASRGAPLAAVALVPLGLSLLVSWPMLRDGPAGPFVGRGVMGIPVLGAGMLLSVGQWRWALVAVGLLAVGKVLAPRARVD